MKKTLLITILLLVLAGVSSQIPAPAYALQARPQVLIPLSAQGAAADLELITQIQNLLPGKKLTIALAPIAVASSPHYIAPAEREILLGQSEAGRARLEEICNRLISAGCKVVLVPAFTRVDADSNITLAAVPQQLSAIVLSGDQPDTALQVLSQTQLEDRFMQAVKSGTILAGKGTVVPALGFVIPVPDSSLPDLEQPLRFFPVQADPESILRPFPFSLNRAWVEGSGSSLSDLALIANNITQPYLPHLGIGLTHGTGFLANGQDKIDKIFGNGVLSIFDAETYHAADGVQYVGEDNFLSMRNILFHVLPPGEARYDLGTRRTSIGAPPDVISRAYSFVDQESQGSGALTLTSSLGDNSFSQKVLVDFTNQAGGETARIAFIAVDFNTDPAAQALYETYSDLLPRPPLLVDLPGDASQTVVQLDDFTGILVTGADPAALKPEVLAPVKDAWLNGAAVLANDGAAAALGAAYAASQDPLTSGEKASEESYRLDEWILSGSSIVNAIIAPHASDRQQWANLITSVFENPTLLGIGLSTNSVLQIKDGEAKVMGEDPVFLVDLRSASLGLGSNQNIQIANGLVDIYAPGEQLEAVDADVHYAPVRMSTPSIPTITPTPTLTATPTNTPTPLPPTATPKTPKPTATLRPTSTPVPVPPAASVNSARLMVIAAGIAVLVVLIGASIGYRTR